MTLSQNHELTEIAGAADQELIGRDTLLGELAQQVVAERLVTLVGPGGVGKTSVARQLATRLAHHGAFRDGVRWVDFAALADGGFVPQAVAAAWALAEQPDNSWAEIVVGALQSRHALLIFDNCEHVRASCADLAARLLAACPQLHILATSREPLGLQAETRHAILPLGQAAAVALFARSAAQQRPSFMLDDRTIASVAEICVRLDGVPLAIELAAARVRLLSVAQIAERLDHVLPLLATRNADFPARHRTLRATLDWSYELLSADEQALLAQLAVFAGSFDLNAVEAVCSLPEPLDLLAELVDKSLVIVLPQNDAPTRYRMHDMVRQYAASRLHTAGEDRTLRLRHLAWALALAEQAERASNHASQDTWLARLMAERENMRGALQTAEDTNDATRMLQLAVALRPFWNANSISEGRAWLARARMFGPQQPSIASITAWNCESFLAYRQGDYDGMHKAATAALREATLAEHAEGIADANYRLGIYAEMKGATQQARTHYQHSLDRYRELGDQRGMSQTLNGLAHVAKFEGNAAEARQYYRQGLALARADDNRLTMALILISLANLNLDTGDLDAAEAAYSESVAHLHAAGNSSYLPYAINGLGEVARYRKDFAAALRHYQEGLDMCRALGLKDMEAQFLGHLGRTAHARGDYLEAARYLSESLRRYLPLERTVRIAGMVHSCAYLVNTLGYPMQATTLFMAGLQAVGAADFAYLGSESAALLAQSMLAARDALAPTDYALASAEGQTLTLDQAAELALSAVFLPLRQVPVTPSPELQISVFGQLRVVRSGHELAADEWVYGKTKDLLVFLLLVDSADKQQIGAALWPNASDSQLKQNFRMAIYHLRRALGRTEWILFAGGRYTFNHALGAWLDLAAFERALAQAESDPARRVIHLRTAAALYTGDLALGELESDTLLIRRERLRDQALAALLALGAMCLQNGEYRAAADAYRRALTLDGYLETAHRGLMRSLARQGEHGAALGHYHKLRLLLDQELGVAPAPETTLLADTITRGLAV